MTGDCIAIHNQQSTLHTPFLPIERNISLRSTPQQDSVSQNGKFSQNVSSSNSNKWFDFK
jgi:hypothetical protein